MDDKDTDAVADRIDRLITLDVPSRGVIATLYGVARRRTDAPLCLAAARRLKACLDDGRKPVFLATGWHDRPEVNSRIAESDGPLGTAVLASALHRLFGAVPFVLVEEHLVASMERLLKVVGLKPLAPEEVIAAATSSAGALHGACVMSFPRNEQEAEAHAPQLLRAYQPAALVSCEIGGMNAAGDIHTFRGNRATVPTPKIDPLFRAANGAGLLTIGIGDGGNEIGFGSVRTEVEERLPEAAPDDDGDSLVPATPVGVLVAATVSNWGAYGVAACLALVEGNATVLHDAGIERKLLETAADAGLIDGISGYVSASADGMASVVHQSVVTLLAETVRQALAKDRTGGRIALHNDVTSRID